MAREKFLDPDYRRDPSAMLFCCRCQRAILGAGFRPYYRVYLRADGITVLHPDDVAGHHMPGDLGWQPIGQDCAHAVGFEWCKRTKVGLNGAPE